MLVVFIYLDFAIQASLQGTELFIVGRIIDGLEVQVRDI